MLQVKIQENFSKVKKESYIQKAYFMPQLRKINTDIYPSKISGFKEK